MKILLLFAIISIFFSFFSSEVYSKTILNPGQTAFTIQSIVFQTDNEGNILFLQGDPSYLNILWNSSFFGGGGGNINATCYFNCNISVSNCNGFQKCTYSGPTGLGVCTITNPNYNKPLSSNDQVSCNFTDPRYPGIGFLLPDGTYPSRSFTPINFQLITSSSATTVGIPVTVPVTVKNVGLFTDSFNFVLQQLQGTVQFKPAAITVGPLTGKSYLTISQADSFSVTILVLAASDTAKLLVTAASNIDPSVSKQAMIEIKTGFASLDDFHFEGILQIILFSAVLLFLTLSRKKLFK